jgi:hypothetical protein
MKITITEPTFFLGENRKPGDVIDVEVGPFRTQVIPGGLTRIKQFVEMPEEIKQVLQDAVGGAVVAAAPPEEIAPAPAAGTFAEATAAVLKPVVPPAPVSRTAAMLSALAGRRRKLEEAISTEAIAYAKELSEAEAAIPAAFTQAKESLADRRASLGEIVDSAKELAGSNGGDPL